MRRLRLGVGDKHSANLFDEAWTVVDVARVDLNQVGSGIEHRLHLLGGHQSAHADDGVGAARTLVDASYDFDGAGR